MRKVGILGRGARKLTENTVSIDADELPSLECENTAPSIDLTDFTSYGLVWSGKEQSLALSASPSAGKLAMVTGAEIPQASDFTLNCFRVNDLVTNDLGHRIPPSISANLIVEGDNLDALKLMLAGGLGSGVRIVYIDPPYNTGNEFGYCDNYRDGIRTKKNVGSSARRIAENCLDQDRQRFIEYNGRMHSRWLSMILPRLILARELMRDDGIICISIDDNEVDKLRLLMAEIFGEQNFLAQITVLSNPRGRQAERHFAPVHEYLLVYAKDADAASLSGVELNEKQLSEFKFTDESGRRYRLLGLRQRGAASRQEDRPALHYPIFVEPATARISLTQDSQFCHVAWPKKSTGAPGRWMWGKERLSANLHLAQAKLIAHRNEWDVFVRDYLDRESGDVRRRKVGTIWMEPELNYQNGKRQLKELAGEVPVDYPKPVALIKKVINLIGDKDAIVMDFFAGTGTTAQAVLEANADDGGHRKFILVQTPEPLVGSKFSTIFELCVERVRQSIRKYAINRGTGDCSVKCRMPSEDPDAAGEVPLSLLRVVH